MDIVFSIDEETGEMAFLVNEVTKDLVPEAQKPRRASHVEPMDWWDRLRFRAVRKEFGDDSPEADMTRNWDVMWQVDLSPVRGPLVEGFASRASAIEFEILWLNENFL